MIVTQISIDLSGINRFEYVIAKQGDVNSRLLQVQLLNNGKVYVLDDQTTARVSITKPDEEEVLQDCTINNNRVEILLDKNILAAAGTAETEIILTGSGGHVLTSATFDIVIVATNTGKNAESSSDYKSFKNALAAVQDIDNKIAQKATKKELAEERARVSGELAAERERIKREIAVERERINQFTRLEEGSTTGDAELTDGRTDYKGETWDNIGDHIRGTSKEISTLADYFSRGISLNEFLEDENNIVIYSYVGADGIIKNEQDAQKWTRTVAIPINSNVFPKLYIKDFIVGNEYISNIAFYSELENVKSTNCISKFTGKDIVASDGEIYKEFYTVDIPKNAKSFIVTYKGDKKPTVVLEMDTTNLNDMFDINNVLFKKVMPELEIIVGGYIDAKGVFVNDSSHCRTQLINVNPGDIIIPSFTCSKDYISVIGFYRSNEIAKGNFISGVKSVLTDEIIVVPEGANYMVVSCDNATKPGCKIVTEKVKEDMRKKLNDCRRYIPVDDAAHKVGQHVNGLTGEYAGSGVYRVLAFDITDLKKSGVTHISTFIQTYSYQEGNNEGYAFFKYGENGEKIYISGGVASKIQTIEDVIIEVPDEASIFELSWVEKELFGAKFRDINGIYFLTATEYNNLEKVNRIEEEIKDVKEKVNIIDNTQYNEIVLGGTVYAVVGDTIQLFYKSFLDCDIENMIVKISCSKGKNYPRYWEYTPVHGEEGDYTINIEIADKKGNVIDSGSVKLAVVSPVNPTAAVNVLCVGDSTMQSGQIPIEASRRLKGTAGTATTPNALSLDNVNFVGRRKNNDNTVGWEGAGGWTYNSYNTKGVHAVRFTVSDASNINISDGYSVNSFRFEITEINVTNGAGNIRCAFSYLTPYAAEFENTAESGVLTRVSGNGQETINFTEWELEYYQPFWNDNTDTFDITSYRDRYCNGDIDIICVLLGVNNLISGDPFMNVSSIIAQAKTFFDNVHAQLPDCKILASTVPLASPKGGIGDNYGSAGNAGAYNANGFNHKIIEFNKALITIGQTDEYKNYVTVINSHAQFDADNCYPSGTKAVNTRSTITEVVQNNAVHPANSGYWQLADALAFRGLLGVLNE